MLAQLNNDLHINTTRPRFFTVLPFPFLHSSFRALSTASSGFILVEILSPASPSLNFYLFSNFDIIDITVIIIEDLDRNLIELKSRYPPLA